MAESKEISGVGRLLRQQAALASFGSYAFREPVLLNILNEAARVCAEGLDVGFCKICRYRAAENDLLIVAGHGWKDGVIGLVVSQADETSPQGRAYVSGQPVILRNLLAANNVRLPPFYADHGIVSTIDVVIKKLDGDPYGVLEVDSPIEHDYNETDIIFLTGFANVLAEAVATASRNQKLRETTEQLEQIIAEKDRLLAERTLLAEELRHRVRNNLQLVHAMLYSHLKAGAGAAEQASIKGIIRRVITLAEVYEQLHGTGMERSIDLSGYLRSLCDKLPSLQGENKDNITLTCDAESMLVGLDTVTALGMVVAELVSNSYEHGKFNGRGAVAVTLRRSPGADQAVLQVSDDGGGFAEPAGSKRHGLGLVHRLMQQIHGIASLDSTGGSKWTCHFPIPAIAF